MTIIITVSRPDYINALFARLEQSNIDHKKFNLLTIVDGDIRLFTDVRNRTESSNFQERLCVQFTSDLPRRNLSTTVRRQRIAQVHNFAKGYINDDYIIGIEDDGEFGPNAIRDLTRFAHPAAGFVSGIQYGRWGIKHAGAWQVDNVYEPKQITSVKWGETEVDAAGLYFFITAAENYIKHDFKPFENILGPDFNYGLWLRQQGHKNYVDWSIPITHKTPKGDIVASGDPQIVQFTKDKHWKQQIIRV